ncbi:MAG: isoprenylcysteine carboxylmethyltransferase family protein [Ignavibacterium sp.]|nr:isoprenylcysteine carboxylmethyltransferase family protein [Ignavibacterium sp.]
MDYFYDVLVLVVLFVLYGYTHSLLASNGFKVFIKKNIGRYIALYRLFYNLVALLGLYLIWEFGPHPSFLIYELSYPYDVIVYGLQLLSLAGIFWCFKYICFKEFIGLAQFNRFINNDYDENELDERATFRNLGPYKFSRHPVYLFSILFLLFRPEMNLFYLTMFISFVIYFYIGSVYEEKKLVRTFGQDYIDYQKRVSRIFPFKVFSNLSGLKSVKGST